ncbi:MAG: DNA polymerase III subunit beta [Candidatus Paceibacterota bacterium]|jgi:DNA polymerase-3 subunit beta
MKIECIKDKLRNAVTQAERLTGKNLSLPILASILIEAKGSKLHIRATNLDLGIELELPVKVEEEGKVAISGSLLNNVLSLLDGDDKIKLETVNDNIVISTKKSSTLVKCFPADDFPTIPRVTDGSEFTITSQKLVLGLRSVWYAASLSDMKPEISSVHVYSEGGEFIFVATDSFRLAEKHIEKKGEGGDDLSIIIPYRNAVELIRIFEGITDHVTVLYTKNQVSFVSEVYGLHITSRLTAGVFPNYRQIVPKEKKTEACIMKKDLLSALKMATLFTDKFNVIAMKIMPVERLCEVTAKNGDVGESVSQLDATLEGDDLQANFNAKYILDSFQSIKEDSIVITGSGPSKPLVIRGIGDNTFLYLVMPINR